MKELNSDLFDPVMVMESEWSRGASNPDADFAFAFNDSNFSDRVLQIEIMGDPVDSRPDSENCATVADWVRHRKRRREDIKKENGLSLTLTLRAIFWKIFGGEIKLDFPPIVLLVTSY